MDKRKLYEEALRRGYHWTMDSACLGEPVSKFEAGGHSQLKVLQKSVRDFCMKCPVAQECLDDSFSTNSFGTKIDDMEFVIRGGYIPTSQYMQKRGRPSTGEPVKVVKPKKSPKIPRFGINGYRMCKNDLHEMTNENVIYVEGAQYCGACFSAKRLRQSAKQKKSHCKNGHLLAGSNVEFYSTGGRRCVACRVERAEDRTRTCARGHERTEENAVYDGHRWRCRVCARLNDHARRGKIEA